MPDVNTPSEQDTTIQNPAEVATETAETAFKSAKDAAAETLHEIDSLQDRMIDTVTASQQEAIETFESAGQAVIELMTRARSEMSDFVAERIRQDLDTHQALLRCRTFDEVRDVQVHFLRTALDQYGTEAAKLVRLGSEVASKRLERRI